MYTLFGSDSSGSAAVEVAFGVLQVPFRIVTASTWEPESAQAELRRHNPLGQIPTLVLPEGGVMTESAAILAYLGLAHPGSGLLPENPAERAQSLRGLVYIAANCYSCIGIIDYPERWLPEADETALEALRQGARRRLHQCWSVFADQFPPHPWLSGAQPGALDYLAAVVSRWSGARKHLQAERPGLFELVQRVEQLPVAAAVFARHFPENG